MAAVETVVICAAGTGSRLGVGVPKCLVSVDGRSIIEHQLDLVANVPDVRVAIGFREEAVVAHVAARRPDAIFVRNTDFRTTGTLTSLLRGAQHVGGPFVALDGDLLVEPASFRAFLDACERLGPPLLGITEATTDDAIFVAVDDADAPTALRAFYPGGRQTFEWSGPAFLRVEDLGAREGLIWNGLEPGLPMPAFVVRTAEIDTLNDLDRARESLRVWEQASSVT